MKMELDQALAMQDTNRANGYELLSAHEWNTNDGPLDVQAVIESGVKVHDFRMSKLRLGMFIQKFKSREDGQHADIEGFKNKLLGVGEGDLLITSVNKEETGLQIHVMTECSYGYDPSDLFKGVGKIYAINQ